MENSEDLEVNQIFGVCNGVIGDRVTKKSSTRSNSSSSDLKSSSTTSTSSLVMNETSFQDSEQFYASSRDSLLTSEDHMPGRYPMSNGLWNGDKVLGSTTGHGAGSNGSAWNPMWSNSFLEFGKVFGGISVEENGDNTPLIASSHEVFDGKTSGKAEIGKPLNPSYEHFNQEFEIGKDFGTMGLRFLGNGNGKRSNDGTELPVGAVLPPPPRSQGNIGPSDKDRNHDKSANLIAQLVNNNDGWGKVPVRQDTPWTVETTADPAREALKAPVKAAETTAAAAGAPRNMSSAFWDSTSQIQNSGDWENQIGVWTGPPDRQQLSNKMACESSADDAMRNHLLRTAPRPPGPGGSMSTFGSQDSFTRDSWDFATVDRGGVRGGDGISQWPGSTAGLQPPPAASHFGSSLEQPPMAGRVFGDAVNMYSGWNETNLIGRGKFNDGVDRGSASPDANTALQLLVVRLSEAGLTKDQILEVLQKQDLSSLNAGGMASSLVDPSRRRPLRGQSYSGSTQTPGMMADAGSLPFSDSRPPYGSSNERGVGRDAEFRNFQRQSSLMHPQQQQQYHHGMNGPTRGMSVMDSTVMDARNQMDFLILKPLLKQRFELLNPLVPRNGAWQQELEKLNSAIASCQKMMEMNQQPHGTNLLGNGTNIQGNRTGSNLFAQPSVQGVSGNQPSGSNVEINNLIQQLLLMKSGSEFESRSMVDHHQRFYGNPLNGLIGGGGGMENRFFDRMDPSMRPPNVSNMDSELAGTKFNRLPPGISTNDFGLVGGGGGGGRPVSASTNHNVPWDLPAFHSSLNWISIQHGPQVTRIDSSLKNLCQQVGPLDKFYYNQSAGRAMAGFVRPKDAVTACSVIASVQIGVGRLQTELMAIERVMKMLEGNVGTVWMLV